MAIKAIETEYKGYRFRSRLEARWAVFFDEMGIEYEYESQGFDFDGLWYLPDFYLPKQHYRYIEIKPVKPGEDDWVEHPVFDKCNKYDWEDMPEFAKRFIVLSGSPWVSEKYIDTYKEGPYTVYYVQGDQDSFEYEGTILGDYYYRWCECPRCRKVGLSFSGRAARLCKCFPEKVYNVASPRLMKAYKAARQARFEHGQFGPPKDWHKGE